MQYDYWKALEQFKKSEFVEIVKSSERALEDRWEQVPYEDSLIKLVDITLRACFSIQDVSAAERMLSKVGNLAALSHYKAALKFYENDIESAWFWLSNSTEHNQARHGFWSLGLNSLPRDKSWYKKLKNINQQSVLDIVPPKENKDFEYAVVFSADSGYFTRFFDYSIRSLREKSESFVAVYLVINPNNVANDIIDRNENSSDVIFLKHYTEKPVGKAYYASSRFYAAYSIINTFEKPVYILDIDLVCKKNLKDLSQELRCGGDYIMIRLQAGVLLPWHRIVANAMYLPACDKSYSFLDKVCRFLDFMFSREPAQNLWWVDQNALFFSYIETDKDSFKPLDGGTVRRYFGFPGMFEDKDKYFGKD